MSTPLSDSTNSPAKAVATRKSSFIGKIFGRKNSKSDLEVKEAVAVEAETVTPTEATPTFFAVVHEFLDGKAEGFFTAMDAMSPDDFAKMAEKHHALGYHNHSFMPTGTSKVLCIWECKADTTVETFQNFIDGPEGPAPGVFVNTCNKVLPGAVTPTSFFNAAPAESAATAASAGSFFWVHHSFKEGAAPAFWEMLQGMKPEDFAAMTASHNKLGFHNHAFLPCALDGPHAAICIWESNVPMDAASFQTFIDGPDGPGAGGVFDNEVYQVMPGAALPPAHFTSSPVVVCQPCDAAAPDKCFGPAGAQAMMWLNKLPDGRQAARIKVQKGFDWRASISPILPGCPQWCPATHFGYLESGTMGIKMKDGTERTIKAGETYLVPPGHLPVMSEDAVMVEFSQDTTYTKDIKK